MRAIIEPDNRHNGLSSDPIVEEQCAYDISNPVPLSLFDNYKWRGPHLESLCFYEYCMLAQTRKLEYSNADDHHGLNFDPNHPTYNTHVQRLAKIPSETATVTFSGQLTESQIARLFARRPPEDSRYCE
jgi:hypothetical protein